MSEAHEIVTQYRDYKVQRGEEMTVSVWMALLGGCRKHEQIRMAQKVCAEMEGLFEPNDRHMISAKVILSNMMAASREASA